MTDDEIKAVRTIYDRGYTVTAAKDIPALLDEIERLRLAEAEAMALVMNHEGHIERLREALAALLPPHSSWCMGHMGGVKDGVGVGPLVVVDCRCEPKVQRARALLGKD